MLAGIDDNGCKHYLCVTASTLCTVSEGSSHVEYVDVSGVVSTSDHFWVFVLRFDTEDDTEDKIRSIGGSDVTGHCYWMPVKFSERGMSVRPLEGFAELLEGSP